MSSLSCEPALEPDNASSNVRAALRTPRRSRTPLQHQTSLPPTRYPAVYVVAVVAAVAADRLYHPECDPFEYRRNEGRGLCFPSPWRRDRRSPTAAEVSAAAGVGAASGAAVAAAAAVPAMAVATLAVTVAPLAAAPAPPAVVSVSSLSPDLPVPPAAVETPPACLRLFLSRL